MAAHDAGAVHTGDLSAELTDARGLHLRAILFRDEQGEDPEPPLTGHRPPPSDDASPTGLTADTGVGEPSLSTN